MEKGAAFIPLRHREVPACGRRFEDAAEGGVPYATAPLIMVLAVLRRPCLACGFSHSQGLKATSRPWLARSCSRSQGSADKRTPGWDISVQPARVGKRKIDPGHYTLFLPARVAHVFCFLSAPQIALSAAHHLISLSQTTIATRTGVLRSSFALFHSKAAPPFFRLFDESPP